MDIACKFMEDQLLILTWRPCHFKRSDWFVMTLNTKHWRKFAFPFASEVKILEFQTANNTKRATMVGRKVYLLFVFWGKCKFSKFSY